MSQDKLEEIARLLGGISDKLDAVVKEQQRLSRIASRWDGDGEQDFPICPRPPSGHPNAKMVKLP